MTTVSLFSGYVQGAVSLRAAFAHIASLIAALAHVHVFFEYSCYQFILMIYIVQVLGINLLFRMPRGNTMAF